MKTEKTIYTCFENCCMQKKNKRTFFHYEKPNYTIFSTEQTELMCENLASLIAPFLHKTFSLGLLVNH